LLHSADLTAVIDWFSSYVLAWQLSNRLEGRFCLEALDAALAHAQPEIFNSDQGTQFTCEAFTRRQAPPSLSPETPMALLSLSQRP
jgi:putative transposase